MNEQLVSQIMDMTSNQHGQFRTGRKKKWTFTLERGQGETYSSPQPTLYGHSTYEKGSVLAGQEQRVFVEQWGSWEQARFALENVKKHVKGFRYEDYGEQGGSTHIPVDVMTRHLPDDTDY